MTEFGPEDITQARRQTSKTTYLVRKMIETSR